MTNEKGYSAEEAIKTLKHRICCEKPIKHFCKAEYLCDKKDCAVLLAISALEKQIPKKPISGKWGRDYSCPSCERMVFSWYDGGEAYANKYEWCRFCGQRLDWSKE